MSDDENEKEQRRIHLSNFKAKNGTETTSAIDAIKRLHEQQNRLSDFYKNNFSLSGINNILGNSSSEQLKRLAETQQIATGEALKKFAESATARVARLDEFSDSLKGGNNNFGIDLSSINSARSYADAHDHVANIARENGRIKTEERDFRETLSRATLEQNKQLTSLADQNENLLGLITILTNQISSFETAKAIGSEQQFTLTKYTFWVSALSLLAAILSPIYTAHFQSPPSVTVTPAPVENIDIAPLLKQLELQTKELQKANRLQKKPSLQAN